MYNVFKVIANGQWTWELWYARCQHVDQKARRSFCLLQSSSLATSPLLPPIITHFHDVQSTLEKSFVSFQHFPPPSSQLPGSQPLIISVQPTMLDHSLSTCLIRFHFHIWVQPVSLYELISWHFCQGASRWFQIRSSQRSINFWSIWNF